MSGLYWLGRLAASTFAVAAVLVVTQDIQIYPGALGSLFLGGVRHVSTLPKGVESIFIDTEDSERIELWRFAPSGGVVEPKKTAVVFHGNAGDVANFFPYQHYLSRLGLLTYGFDYRGYGKSSGWPTEKGLYADGRAVIRYVLRNEDLDRKDLVLVGVSIGTGPAARLAKEFDAGTLVLITPFTSLPDLVSTMPAFGLLSPFLFHKFPVREYVSSLEKTCFIVGHGKPDTVVPFKQGREVFDAYRGSGKKFFIQSETAGHNNLFFSSWQDIRDAIKVCTGIGMTEES